MKIIIHIFSSVIKCLINKSKFNIIIKIFNLLDFITTDKRYNKLFIKKVFDNIDEVLCISINNKQCLLRATIAKLLLSINRIKVSLKIGVIPEPFRAHAWLEINNKPLYEIYEDTSKYMIIYNDNL
ncbi:MAG: lasso peptide biosynthesis B2 protein [bacterium]